MRCLERAWGKGDKPDCGGRSGAAPAESDSLKLKRKMKGLSEAVDAEVV